MVNTPQINSHDFIPSWQSSELSLGYVVRVRSTGLFEGVEFYVHVSFRISLNFQFVILNAAVMFQFKLEIIKRW